jgi:hypothetical protein
VADPEKPKFKRSPRKIIRQARAEQNARRHREIPAEVPDPETEAREEDPSGPVKLLSPAENFSSTWPLTKEGIDSAMFERLEDIRSCYEQALTGDDELEGNVAVGFTIQDDASGDEAYVHQVETESADLVDQVMMRGCIATIVEELRFEASSSGEPTLVRYPFVFSPG